MKNLICISQRFLVVLVCYSLALATPAQANTRVSYRDMITMMKLVQPGAKSKFKDFYPIMAKTMGRKDYIQFRKDFKQYSNSRADQFQIKNNKFYIRVGQIKVFGEYINRGIHAFNINDIPITWEQVHDYQKLQKILPTAVLVTSKYEKRKRKVSSLWDILKIQNKAIEEGLDLIRPSKTYASLEVGTAGGGTFAAPGALLTAVVPQSGHTGVNLCNYGGGGNLTFINHSLDPSAATVNNQIVNAAPQIQQGASCPLCLTQGSPFTAAELGLLRPYYGTPPATPNLVTSPSPAPAAPVATYVVPTTPIPTVTAPLVTDTNPFQCTGPNDGSCCVSRLIRGKYVQVPVSGSCTTAPHEADPHYDALVKYFYNSNDFDCPAGKRLVHASEFQLMHKHICDISNFEALKFEQKQAYFEPKVCVSQCTGPILSKLNDATTGGRVPSSTTGGGTASTEAVPFKTSGGGGLGLTTDWFKQKNSLGLSYGQTLVGLALVTSLAGGLFLLSRRNKSKKNKKETPVAKTVVASSEEPKGEACGRDGKDCPTPAIVSGVGGGVTETASVLLCSSNIEPTSCKSGYRLGLNQKSHPNCPTQACVKIGNPIVVAGGTSNPAPPVQVAVRPGAPSTPTASPLVLPNSPSTPTPPRTPAPSSTPPTSSVSLDRPVNPLPFDPVSVPVGGALADAHNNQVCIDPGNKTHCSWPLGETLALDPNNYTLGGISYNNLASVTIEDQISPGPPEEPGESTPNRPSNALLPKPQKEVVKDQKITSLESLFGF